MTDPTTAREALIAEAVGDAARLARQMEALAPALGETCEALLRANTCLQDQLLAFETRIATITDVAKTRTVQHLATRIDDCVRRSIEQQRRAMADAARAELRSELEAAVRHRQTERHPRWERWLTHAAAAACASALTWSVAVWVWQR
jgi:hypothetical protein